MDTTMTEAGEVHHEMLPVYGLPEVVLLLTEIVLTP